MELFDSHLHLDDDAFARDLEAVLDRARAAGIVGMVTVGTGVDSSRAAVTLAARQRGVFAAAAIHPHDAREATAAAIAALRTLAADARVVAVGETGLDYAKDYAPRDVQRDAFVRHIALSRELDRPLIIHCRQAYPEVLEILEREGASRVIMHAFSGSLEIAQECARRGYAISVAGPVTFRNARSIAQVAREAPLDALLVETDAPVLTPEPFRGRRNEPAYLSYIVQRVAQLRGMPAEDVARATTANAQKAYRVPSVLRAP